MRCLLILLSEWTGFYDERRRFWRMGRRHGAFWRSLLGAPLVFRIVIPEISFSFSFSFRGVLRLCAFLVAKYGVEVQGLRFRFLAAGFLVLGGMTMIQCDTLRC